VVIRPLAGARGYILIQVKVKSIVPAAANGVGVPLLDFGQ